MHILIIMSILLNELPDWLKDPGTINNNTAINMAGTASFTYLKYTKNTIHYHLNND